MTTFTDVISSRALAPVNDTMVAGSLIGASGQEYIQEDGSASRAWRHEDTAAGLEADFLPDWGVTDWTMAMYTSATSNYNPSGFSTYRAWSLCEGTYTTSPLYLRSNTSTTLRLVIDNAVNVDIPRGWVVVRLESSNLAGGVVQRMTEGRQGADTAHGQGSAPARTTPTIHQLGGKYTTNDYGIIGNMRFAHFWIAHEWVPTDELREMYRIARVLG